MYRLRRQFRQADGSFQAVAASVANKQALSREQLVEISQWLQDEPKLTLTELRQKTVDEDFFGSLDDVPDQSTLYRQLKAMGFHWGKVRYSTPRAKRDVIKYERCAFRKAQGNGLDTTTLLSMDESNFHDQPQKPGGPRPSQLFWRSQRVRRFEALSTPPLGSNSSTGTRRRWFTGSSYIHARRGALYLTRFRSTRLIPRREQTLRPAGAPTGDARMTSYECLVPYLEGKGLLNEDTTKCELTGDERAVPGKSEFKPVVRDYNLLWDSAPSHLPSTHTHISAFHKYKLGLKGVIFTPPYSAWYNPIELFFSFAKRYIRKHAPATVPELVRRLREATAKGTGDMIKGWYRKSGYLVPGEQPKERPPDPNGGFADRCSLPAALTAASTLNVLTARASCGERRNKGTQDGANTTPPTKTTKTTSRIFPCPEGKQCGRGSGRRWGLAHPPRRGKRDGRDWGQNPLRLPAHRRLLPPLQLQLCRMQTTVSYGRTTMTTRPLRQYLRSERWAARQSKRCGGLVSTPRTTSGFPRRDLRLA